MILLSNIAKRILNEILSFKELMKFSEPRRKKRALKMSTTSLPMTAEANQENWNFSYKSDNSHITPRSQNDPRIRKFKNVTSTGIRHRGRITFQKVKDENKSLIDIPCKVDCTCEDYRYKYAFANNDKDASPMGAASLNQCNGKYPRITNPHLRPGLCKHLLSLRDYLRTKLEESNKPTLAEKLDDIVQKYPTDVLQVKD